ncbi:MAG: type II toxin-antitoxin system RelE/ParE family toxin [Terracidiphilus sp.]
MKRAVRFTKAARADLEEIYEWIAEHDSPAHADYVLDHLSAAAARIAGLPGSGSRPRELPPGMKADYRQVFFKPYRVIYQVRQNEIVIHLIADGRRNLQMLLLRRLIAE